MMPGKSDRLWLFIFFICCFAPHLSMPFDIPPISCPQYFEYLQHKDIFIGRITLRNQVWTSLKIDVDFSQQQPYVGERARLLLFDNLKTTLENVKNDNTIRFRVDFADKKIPSKLTQIAVNNLTICSAAPYDPPSYRFSLQYKFSRDANENNEAILYSEAIKDPEQTTAKFVIATHARVDWYTANRHCNLLGMALASINNEAENNFLKDFLARIGMPANNYDRYWISGLKIGNNNDWVWSDAGNPIEYKNWGPGEPNNDKKHENCIEITHDHTWNDAECVTKNMFICRSR